MEAHLQQILVKPLSELPTYSDVGRLGKRIDVLSVAESSSAAANHGDEGTESERVAMNYENGEEASHAVHLARVLRKVVNVLEAHRDSEYKAKVYDAIDVFLVAVGDQPDIQFFVRDLFQAFDLDGPTVRVFKFVNQATLVHAITVLKLTISNRESYLSQDLRLTKDVRGATGWRIEINIGSTEICVSHIRREQCLGKPFWKDNWEIHWRLDIFFTKDMTELRRTQIVILDLIIGSKISNKDATELRRLFGTGVVDWGDDEALPAPPKCSTSPANQRRVWRMTSRKCIIS